MRCADRFFLVLFLLVEGTVQCLNDLYQFLEIVFLRRFFGQNPPFFIVGHNCTPLLVVCLLPRLALCEMRHVEVRPLYA